MMGKNAKKSLLILVATLGVCSLAFSGCSSGDVGSGSGGDTNSGSSIGASSDSSAEVGFQQVSSREAMEMMETESDFVILDVRTEAEFAEDHIPGAINVPVESIGSEPPSQLPDKDELIMVYCRSGNRSVTASEKLVDLGYTNIVEFGGINSWPGEIVS